MEMNSVFEIHDDAHTQNHSDCCVSLYGQSNLDARRNQLTPGNACQKALSEGVWGLASAIDIYDCNPDTIRDADAIKRFVVDLCDLIEMKRFGETQVVHFGEDEKVAGYSMVQLIETSLISAHFANLTNAVYLDVFSCKPYEPEEVRSFAQLFFGGARSTVQVALRR